MAAAATRDNLSTRQLCPQILSWPGSNLSHQHLSPTSAAKKSTGSKIDNPYIPHTHIYPPPSSCRWTALTAKLDEVEIHMPERATDSIPPLQPKATQISSMQTFVWFIYLPIFTFSQDMECTQYKSMFLRDRTVCMLWDT